MTSRARRTYAIAIFAMLSITGLAGVVLGMNPLNPDDRDQDPDGDGLNNFMEFIHGSDPNNWDSDGDSLPDGWEVNNQLDPSSPSDAFLDNDWFSGEEWSVGSEVPTPYTNVDEYWRFAWIDSGTGENVYIPTNPNNPDTDGDGIMDPDDPWPWDFDDDGPSGQGNGGSDNNNPNPLPDVTPPKDTDGDGLRDQYEMSIGTDYQNKDTDGDGLLDPLELTLGLDPNDWDTDDDMLIDGVELGLGFSTDGHLQDSDEDGLPDPWEDNDGDGILNIEEQDIALWFLAWMTGPAGGGGGRDPYLTSLISYRFRLDPNSNDTDSDDISDDLETQAYGPGPINDNSRSEYNYHQVNNETGQGQWIPDRWNSDHDLSNPNSGFSKWTEGRYSYWEYWFDRSFEMGELPVQTYNVVLYEMNPWLLWYQNWDSVNHLSPEEFARTFYHSNDPLDAYSSYTTWDDAIGWMEKGPATTDPKFYRWNMYDINPAEDDTDGDRMEDPWDPRPTIPDDRLDTTVALHKVGYPQPGGGLEWYDPAFGPYKQSPVSALFMSDNNGPTWSLGLNNFQSISESGQLLHDYYGFPYRIIDSTMNKGMGLYMEMIVGVEGGHPGSEFFSRGFYSFLNVTLNFHNGSIDVDPDDWITPISDNVSYDMDDDIDGDGIPRYEDEVMGVWQYTPQGTTYSTFPLDLWDLSPGNIVEEMNFEHFNPSEFIIDGYGPWAGPDDPYVDPFSGEGHSGLQVPFINVSNYPDINALHPSGSNLWFYWSTMTFYKIGFHFMVPEGVMAGYVVMDMSISTDQNIHVEQSFDAFAQYPYIAY
jgi:thrombospondin type 3 repeat protein